MSVDLGDVTLVVVGFGRCGSTLAMRMLHAGGVPVYADDLRSFETDSSLTLPRETVWLNDARGRAVKVLDPLRYQLPRDRPYRFLWMNRDPIEQARSAMKFMSATSKATVFGGMVADTMGQGRDTRRTMAASYRRDRPKALSMLRGYPGSTLVELAFEALLLTPRRSAVLMTELAPGLDVEAAVREVLPRGPGCYKGILELGLSRHAKRAEDAGPCLP